MRCLAPLQVPSEGEIRFGDIDVRKEPEQAEHAGRRLERDPVKRGHAAWISMRQSSNVEHGKPPAGPNGPQTHRISIKTY
jgi:hypothetical protein